MVHKKPVERLKSLTPEQRAYLLQALNKNKSSKFNEGEVIPKTSSIEINSLSSSQLRLWIQSQMEKDNPFYNIPLAIQLEGELNLEALTWSLKQIVLRHEILLSTYELHNAQPVQIQQKEIEITIPVVDMRKEPRETLQQKINETIQTHAKTRFNLTKSPLFSVQLIQIDTNKYIFLFTVHHIIFDGWSRGVFLQELSHFYKCWISNTQSNLPEPKIQYRDYSNWQLENIKNGKLSNQREYWINQFSNGYQALQLPTDFKRPAKQTFRGDVYPINISSELANCLRLICKEQKITLFMLLLAVFKLQLYRYTGQAEITVGTPVAGRTVPELEGLIGCFINTLPLKTKLNSNDTLSDLLQSVKRTTLEGFLNQNFPFEKLVEELKVDRNLSHHPLFQVMFIMQNARIPSIELDNLNISPLETHSGTAKFDLTIELFENEDGIKGWVEYNTDLFKRDTISRVIGHYELILKQLETNMETPVQDIILLTDDEYSQFKSWNNTSVLIENKQGIHQLIEYQSIKNPDRIALIFESQKITYNELNTRANQLAHMLKKYGVGNETLVGICTERSVEMIIGLLAILKAGGAYVPLDPSYPEERISYMLEDSKVKVLLTQSRLQTHICNYHGQIICLDKIKETLNYESQENINQEFFPEQLMYVIYTSGSTGRPKGVMNTHRGVYNRLLWMQKAYQLSTSECVIQKTPISFDVSVWELFWPLMVGAQMLIAKPDGHKDPEYLVELISEHNVTTIHFVPSMLKVFLEQEKVEQCNSLKRVICSGEALSSALQNKFYKRLSAQLYNLYGPTEAAIDVTEWACKQHDTRNVVPIGYPIDNIEIYILDRNFQHVPIGVAGELYIGGMGLSRGYQNNAGQTAERFLPNPFSNIAGSYMYRTGDLARFSSEGAIEYLDRIDHQVKIRGFRIETGEIEYSLSLHPEVKENLVLVKEDPVYGKRLIAFIVPSNRNKPKKSHIIKFLKKTLPDFMVPSTMIWLDEIPLLPNGKVDRKKLNSYDLPNTVDEEIYASPRNEIEEILVNIWSEVLPIERIGINHNFFEIGGDSILSIQIASRINQAGIRVSMKQIFENQTIAELAQVVKFSDVTKSEQKLVLGQVELTPIQYQFFEREFEDQHHHNQAVMLIVSKSLSSLGLSRIINRLLLHHDALRLKFYKENNKWKQRFGLPEENCPLNLVDLSNYSVDKQISVIEETANKYQNTLNIVNGPLIRFIYYKCGNQQKDRLLIIAHHLIIDGVSWRIILEDLSNLVNSDDSLPPKTVSYREWSNKLREWGNHSDIIKTLSYWNKIKACSKQAGTSSMLTSKATNPTYTTNTFILKMNQKETKDLLENSQRAYQTQIHELLLTALLQAIQELWKIDALQIDLEGHGREELIGDLDLTRTVGWFTSIYPVYLTLLPTRDLAENIIGIKEQLRQVPYKGVSYGILRYLAEKKIRQSLQEFDNSNVCFNYLGQLDQAFPNHSVFQLATESVGNNISLRQKRAYALEFNCSILRGQLHIAITYDNNKFSKECITIFSNVLKVKINELIRHCVDQNCRRYTPSDFNLIELKQKTIDHITDGFDEIEDIYGLTPMQLVMVTHNLLAIKSGNSTQTFSCYLEGNVDSKLFREAWNIITERHSILRTSIHWRKLDVPVQIVHKRAVVDIEELDWSELLPEKQGLKLKEYIDVVCNEPFVLSEPGQMRLSLIKLAKDCYRFVWNYPTSLFDGWSWSIILQEVLTTYNALIKGTSPLLKKTQSYSNYVKWLQHQDLAVAEKVWTEHFQGYNSQQFIGIPQQNKEVINNDYIAGDIEASLSKEITEQINTFCKTCGITLNTILQGAWAIVLGSISGSNDIICGVLNSGRPAEINDVDSMVGSFVNTMPIRIKIENDNTIQEWLKDIQYQQSHLIDYGFINPQQIARWTNIPKTVIQKAIYETTLVFIHAQEEAFKQLDSQVRVYGFKNILYFNVPLRIYGVPGERLGINIKYNKLLYKEEDVNRAINNMLKLLSNLISSRTVGDWRFLLHH
ncbi:non-ribosomal peptide synthetase [Bacillus wiedmannii]|uniref:non-ribosomal peptide synthetase n=1 Tax=Bacillus wiedmannii TaxID=1890302 RepID=UPI0015CF0E8E|nr:non-ribosomal peptide synthetase [Bacillus wiedmannii]